MWNGRSKFTAVSLAAAFAAGCSEFGAPALAPQAASAVAASPSPAEHRRSDRVRERTWVLSERGVILYDLKRGERTPIALPRWHWAGGRYGCLPALALGPKGEVVITSDVVPTLWKIDPETLLVTVHTVALDSDTEMDVGFAELAYSPRHGAYYAVSHAHGTIWKVDTLLRRAQKTSLAMLTAKTCIS